MSKSSSSSEELLKTDWYGVLSVPQEASDEVITKAARKMGLRYHPDKTDDPKDHELFLLVQKAKETLLDVAKRNEYDKHINTIKARKEYESEREKGMDSRRKRMRDELESKLSAAQQSNRAPSAASGSFNKNNSSSSSSSGINRNKMADDNLSFMEREREKEYTRKKASEAGEEVFEADDRCQLKVKWKRNKVLVSHSDDSLYQLFKIYGDIEDVALTGDTGNAAIITFKTRSAAMKAFEAYTASTDYRLTIIDGNKKKTSASIFTHVYTEAKQHPGYASNVAPTSQEEELADAIRRSMQRDALIRQMEAAEQSGHVSAEQSGHVSTGAQPKATNSNPFFRSDAGSQQKPVLEGELHDDFKARLAKYCDKSFDFSWEYVAQREAHVFPV